MDQKCQIVQSLLRPGALVSKDGSAYNSDLLKDVKVFVLYFSAHWCPPCRQFTPILAEQFRSYRQTSSKAMVIFVSGDRSFQEQLSYMQEAHGDWPAVQCNSSLQNQLNTAFSVRGIPYVVAVKVSNGEIISQEGRNDIMQNGSYAFTIWEQSCIEIDTSIANKLNDNEQKVFQDAKEILLKLLNNILRDPHNVKYRRIRLNNPKVETMLLNANGAFEILFSVGFEEDSDALVLPLSAPIEILKSFVKTIESLSGPVQKPVPKTEPQPKASTSTKIERDVICNGDVCLDIGKERPLIDFEKHAFMPYISTRKKIDRSTIQIPSGNLFRRKIH